MIKVLDAYTFGCQERAEKEDGDVYLLQGQQHTEMREKLQEACAFLTELIGDSQVKAVAAFLPRCNPNITSDAKAPLPVSPLRLAPLLCLPSPPLLPALPSPIFICACASQSAE